MSTFYLTTPIFYVNGSPHIGHAYTAIAADVIARFHRLDGTDTHFLTGTDEHGQKVEKAAAAAGQDPQSFTDTISAEFRTMLETLNISNDDFIRTTDPRHKAGAIALWEKLAVSDDIYLGHYEGWYAVRDEDFYSPDDLVTLEDGTRLAPTGAPVEWVREPNYLFRLSAYQDRLLAHYEANPDFIGPAAINQVRLFNLHPSGAMQKNARLESVMGEGGVADCGKAQNCVEVCPKDIPLVDSISSVARETTKRMLFGWLFK